MKRRVDLKSGGYLIIDQTEAMTTIDVNTGGYVGGRSFSETIFKTNLEAAQAIARQLRLRNLGGIILVDFIDMADEAHREQVQQELGHGLEQDRTKVRISGFTSLGARGAHPQAHARFIGPAAQPDLPHLRGPRAHQNRADHLL